MTKRPDNEESCGGGEGTANIARTTRTASIRMIDTDISVFVNEHGQGTPILIVARCKLDNIEYAALYDTHTTKRYVVEIVRVRNQIKEFRDLDGNLQDEEWAVISNFFLQQKVYERQRMSGWIANTLLRKRLSLGASPVLQTRMKRYKDGRE